MRVVNHEKGIDLKLSCLNVGDLIFFKSGSMAHKKGMATNQELGKEVTGFVFDLDGLMVYVRMEDAIGWEIDWDKTIDANYQEARRLKGEKFWAVINKAKEAIKKDKDMNRIEDLKVGMTVYFKGDHGYVNEGEATSENNDGKVTGFIFDGDTSKIYVSTEDLGIDIDWEKTREENKDKDMKFTSCQNVDCNKEYDFNDLIDVATKAVSDEVIEEYEVGKTDKGLYISFVCDFGMSTKYFKCDWCEAVLFINSLYTETFVIEKKEDILRIRQGAKITAINGKEFIISEHIKFHTHVNLGSLSVHIAFLSLIGATVTQKRSTHE